MSVNNEGKSRILFSPVGGTDPISNYHDGALLHIARIYRPDEVYIFLSKEMLELERKDNRYTYCLEQLGKHVEQGFKVNKLEDEDLSEVHLFDTFIIMFKKILNGIAKKYPESEIIVNVSSGTPAMKSALQVLASLSEFKLTPIQVSTPKKELNDREDIKKGYDVEEQWECNYDNEEGFINRCSQSSNINLMVELQKDIIAKHISVYDYVAALAVANTLKGFLKDDVYTLLNVGIARLALDKNEIDKLLIGTGYDINPVKNSEDYSTFEYLLTLQVRLEKEEYGDFIRAITPVFFKLLERTLKNKFQFDLKEFTLLKYGKRIWDERKVNTDPLIDLYNNPLSGDIKTDNLVKIIGKISGNPQNIAMINELRDVEEKIRNIAAHEITCINKSVIKKNTNLEANQILEKLKQLAKYSGIKAGKEEWKSYDALNKLIEEALTDF